MIPDVDSDTQIYADRPTGIFNASWYLAHNAARQSHLAYMRLPISGRSVLELGAGVGWHTKFFLDRGCDVTITDGREENVAILKERYPGNTVRRLDVENPGGEFNGQWDIVYCYGVLYHLAEPMLAISNMAKWCGELLLLETCIAKKDEVKPEDATSRGNSLTGSVRLLTNSSIVASLKSLFPYVYRSRHHPMGAAFDVSVDWVDPRGECRAAYVASKRPVEDLRALVIQ